MAKAAIEECIVGIEVNGIKEAVICRKEKSDAFEYGNGSMVVLDSLSIRRMNWNRPLLVDTRYVLFDKFDGFEEFCKGYLRDYGFKVE